MEYNFISFLFLTFSLFCILFFISEFFPYKMFSVLRLNKNEVLNRLINFFSQVIFNMFVTPILRTLFYNEHLPRYYDHQTISND